MNENDDEFDESDAQRAWLAHPITVLLLKELRARKQRAEHNVFAALRETGVEIADARFLEGMRVTFENVIERIEKGRPQE